MYENVSVEIIEQPAEKYGRFRYRCEGRTAGSIIGINSSFEKRSYPAIRLLNYTGTAIILVSCVSKDEPYRPHPYSIVGKDGCCKGVCKKEFITNELTPTVITFKSVGIQCCKKKDVEKMLTEREELRIDPFKTGFKHKKIKYSDKDLNTLRLCFQVLLKPSNSGDGHNTKYVPVKPVVSNPISDTRCTADLQIYDISDTTSPTCGGKKIMIFVERVLRTDIKIRFFRKNGKDSFEWEEWGKFSHFNVHRQSAISFKTPPYSTSDIANPVKVSMQLVRPSDGRRSDPIDFHYIPHITNMNNAIKDKKRKMEESKEFQEYLQGFREHQRQKTKIPKNIDAMTGCDPVLAPAHQSDLNFPNNGQGFEEHKRRISKMDLNINHMTGGDQVLAPAQQSNLNFSNNGQGFREQERQRSQIEINSDLMTRCDQLLAPSHQSDLNFSNNRQAFREHQQQKSKVVTNIDNTTGGYQVLAPAHQSHLNLPNNGQGFREQEQQRSKIAINVDPITGADQVLASSHQSGLNFPNNVQALRYHRKQKSKVATNIDHMTGRDHVLVPAHQSDWNFPNNVQGSREQERQMSKMEININPMTVGDQVLALPHQSDLNFPNNEQGFREHERQMSKIKINADPMTGGTSAPSHKSEYNFPNSGQAFLEHQRQRSKMEIDINAMTGGDQVSVPSHQPDLNLPNNGLRSETTTLLAQKQQQKQSPHPQRYNYIQQFSQNSNSQNICYPRYQEPHSSYLQQKLDTHLQQNTNYSQQLQSSHLQQQRSHFSQHPQNSHLQQQPQSSHLKQQHTNENVCYLNYQVPLSSRFQQVLDTQQQQNIHLQQPQNNHFQQQSHVPSSTHFQHTYSSIGYGLNPSNYNQNSHNQNSHNQNAHTQNYNAVPHCYNVDQMHNSTAQNINQFCVNNMTVINHQQSNWDKNLVDNNVENIENIENTSDNFEDSFNLLLP